MNNAQSLIIGVVSGIVTTALIYLAVQIFRKIVIPWYQSIIYQGLIVSGEWRVASLSTGEGQEIVLNLTQKAHRLEGTATYVRKTDTSNLLTEHIKTFQIEGRVADRFAVLTLRHTERNRIGVEVLLLEIIGDGRKMAGYTTFYDVVENRIVSYACMLGRSETLVPSAPIAPRL